MTNDIIVALTNMVKEKTDLNQLPIAVSVQENTKIMTRNRFAVLPGEISEIEGTIRHYTVDQLFTIKLTNDYVKLNADDTGKRQATNSLYGLAHDIYKEAIQKKAGRPDIVMNVKGLSVEAPEYFEEEDTVLLSVNFFITYRNQI